MRSDSPDHKSVIVAAIAASLLMAILGMTHRILAARLCAPANETPINPAAVERFPMQIGGWRGQDVPLDEEVVRKTGTDARINHRYSRSALQSVLLYVACGVNAGHLMSHRPEVCYGLPVPAVPSSRRLGMKRSQQKYAQPALEYSKVSFACRGILFNYL